MSMILTKASSFFTKSKIDPSIEKDSTGGRSRSLSTSVHKVTLERFTVEIDQKHYEEKKDSCRFEKLEQCKGIDLASRAEEGAFRYIQTMDTEVHKVIQQMVGGDEGQKNLLLKVSNNEQAEAFLHRLALTVHREDDLPHPFAGRELFQVDMDKNTKAKTIYQAFQESKKLKDKVILVTPDLKKLHNTRYRGRRLTYHLEKAINSGLKVILVSNSALNCEKKPNKKRTLSKQAYEKKLEGKKTFATHSVDPIPADLIRQELKGEFVDSPREIPVTEEALDMAIYGVRHASSDSLEGLELLENTKRFLQFCIAEAKIRHSKLEGEGDSLTLAVFPNDVRQTLSLHYRGKFFSTEVAGLDKERVLELPSRLKNHVLGQDHVIEQVVDQIKLASTGLRDPSLKRPVASFFFTGLPGVGKTELAKSLAKELDGYKLLQFHCTEFIKEHEYARLVGSPPGYIAHEEGGQLTEPLREHPQTVVLLDELHLANRKVIQLLRQILDEGVITDGKGRQVDCSQAIFIGTGNVAQGEIVAGLKLGTPWNEINEKAKKEVSKIVSAPVADRFDGVIAFAPLDKKIFKKLVEKRLQDRFDKLEDQGVHVTWTKKLVRFLARKGKSPHKGHRPLDHLIDKEMGSKLADLLLEKKLERGDTVTFDIDECGEIFLCVEENFS